MLKRDNLEASCPKKSLSVQVQDAGMLNVIEEHALDSTPVKVKQPLPFVWPLEQMCLIVASCSQEWKARREAGGKGY